jgi:hypothetical protein
VHLAYFDETGTDGRSPIVMFGALIVPSGKFGYLSSIYEVAIQQIVPTDKIDHFKEFHASALYYGDTPFDTIDEEKRFNAIRVLLSAVAMNNLPFAYTAVDRKRFADSPFAIMRPLNVAFHMCLLGVEDWALANHPSPHPRSILIDWDDTYLCILDDCSDKELKANLRKSYRSLRSKYPFITQKNRLWHAHDDMFFADSTDCLGIQIADLCNFFVRLRLEGKEEPQHFYDMIARQVICARTEPEWGQYKHLLRNHEAV